MKSIKRPIHFTLCLLPAVIIAGVFGTIYSMSSADSSSLERAIQQVGSKETVMIISALQPILYGAVLGFLGYIIADKLGLIRPLSFGKKETLAAVMGGSAFGLILAADAFTFAKLIPELQGSYDSTPLAWIAAITYGGVLEEIMMRLFCMSLFALIGWKLFFGKEEKAPDKVLIVANILAALLFAAGHLPSTKLLFGELTPMLIFRCFLMNGAFGLIAGRLYRKYGIQYAMIAHILAHIVSKTIWLIVL